MPEIFGLDYFLDLLNLRLNMQTLVINICAKNQSLIPVGPYSLVAGTWEQSETDLK